MIAVDSPPGITRPSRSSSCSGLRTSTGSAPSRRSIAACSRKSPCTARIPIFTPKIVVSTLSVSVFSRGGVHFEPDACDGRLRRRGVRGGRPAEPVADRPEGADYPALDRAYHDVTLTNLDGSGYLSGDYANVLSETGDAAFSLTNEFNYRRDDDRFEQVLAYYWVTEAQRYIQELGFGVTRRAINKESQDLRINTFGQDNSFSWDKKDVIRLGKGGVDDAEDAEVILHELGPTRSRTPSRPRSASATPSNRARSARALPTTGR